MSTVPPPRGPVTTTPIYSLIALVIFMAAVVVLAMTGDLKDNPELIGIVAISVPSLVAAIAAERAARDIRNGTIVEKSRQGAHKAIEEAGVIVRDGPVVRAQLELATTQLESMRTLLGDVHGMAQANAEKITEMHDEQKARNGT